jgi:hypothetical protein
VPPAGIEPATPRLGALRNVGGIPYLRAWSSAEGVGQWNSRHDLARWKGMFLLA